MADALLALREYAKLAPWNIRDLSTIAGGILEASGVTPINAAAQSKPSDRTIRFYVTRRLLSAPDGRGTAATYGYRHLLQLLAIKLRQMEGVTLVAIAKELAEAPGDVLEKRVVAALGTVPQPNELEVEPRGTPRGRVARVLHQRGAAAEQRSAADKASAAIAAPSEGAGWFRIAIGEALVVSIRTDHPAARGPLVLHRVAAAVAAALAESAEEAAH
jgi:DNA-binding transcriptional MerR regulator